MIGAVLGVVVGAILGMTLTCIVVAGDESRNVTYVKPEQAIETTLEPGMCRVDVLNTGDCAGYECSEYIMHCNGCGHEFGHVLYNEDGDVWMSEPPNFCPNCGRRVINE